MIVSTPDVKRFLLEVIEQAAFPGRMAEFVSNVKAEIAQAEIDPPANVGGIDQTASDRMLSHKAEMQRT